MIINLMDWPHSSCATKGQRYIFDLMGQTVYRKKKVLVKASKACMPLDVQNHQNICAQGRIERARSR